MNIYGLDKCQSLSEISDICGISHGCLHKNVF